MHAGSVNPLELCFDGFGEATYGTFGDSRAADLRTARLAKAVIRRELFTARVTPHLDG